MNSYWSGYDGQVFVMTQALRDQMMDSLTDADLVYTPGGDNPTLGELCLESGGVEYAYTQSFKTLNLDWAYPTTEPDLGTSVEKLTAWFKELDADLNATLEGYSDEEMDIAIQRGWPVPRRVQAYLYREAMFIFYGRASVYLRALRKPVTEQWKVWIGE